MARNNEAPMNPTPAGKPSIKDIGQIKSGGAVKLSNRSGSEYCGETFADSATQRTGGSAIQKKGSTSVSPTPGGTEYRQFSSTK